MFWKRVYFLAFLLIFLVFFRFGPDSKRGGGTFDPGLLPQDSFYPPL